MARARNIKPGFFKNEDLAECTPWARLCFAGLWTLADREGRLEDRPKRIKGELFAFDSIEVEPLLAELVDRGFVLRYRAGELRLLQVLKFSKHQNPHHREPSSVLPSPQSLGLAVDAMNDKPGAESGSHEDEAQGEAEAGPGLGTQSDDMARGSSRAESGTLIPDTGKKKPAGAAAVRELPEVSDQVWLDWASVRKARKAGPVTPTVAAILRREAEKAGVTPQQAVEFCCGVSWQNFNAEWYQQRISSSSGRAASVLSADEIFGNCK